ncbi:MAG: VWA domain-containing protein [Acidobacteriota bacterium]|nr:VWA domain-containing protein [Acidobacteriota bacterium]
MRRGRAAVVAGLVSLGVLASAQQPDQQPAQEPQQPIFRAGTDLVRVDVTVTGRDDQPVTDLHVADFEVTEDGVPQVVETMQLARVDGVRTTDLNEPLEIRSREHALLEAAREDVRLFGIFLDDYHIDKRPEITLPLREAVISFIKQLGPNDLAVMMEPLESLRDLKYTRSKDELIARVRTFEGRRGETFPVKSAVEEAQLTQRNWMELRGGVTLSALGALATQFGGLREGRKSILFFSQGPPVRPGSPNDQLYKEAIEAANRGNVTIHVIDPRPLGSVGFGGDDILRRIAYDTGGRAIVSTNDPERHLRTVMSDASSYYLIGYTPTRRTNDGKFHEIKVRVNRRGVNVTARRGYWAASEKEITAAAEAAAMPVNTALTTALSAMSDSAAGRAVTIWTGVSKGEAGRTRLTYAWEAAPAPASADKPARLEIQPVDDAGKESMPAQVIGGAPGELPLMAHFEWPAGRQRLRFTSLTQAGETIDRWVQAQVVPDLSKSAIVLATPRFLRARNMIELRAIEANPSASPTATTRFTATERVLVEIAVDSPAGDAAQVKVELLDAKGSPLRVLDAPPLSGGRLRMLLPVGSLANSTYLLKVTATVAEQSAEQWVAFRVAR